MTAPEPDNSVMLFSDLFADRLQGVLNSYGLVVIVQPEKEAIVGSFWGDSEAGLVRDELFVRPDTPVHSALHEACHYICMDDNRRDKLHTDAGGDYDEENAVCYLQILLSNKIPEMGQARMLNDMDAWGYTFRLGNARRWFEEDSEDARTWLADRQLLPLL